MTDDTKRTDEDKRISQAMNQWQCSEAEAVARLNDPKWVNLRVEDGVLDHTLPYNGDIGVDGWPAK